MTWFVSRTGIPGAVCGSFPRTTTAASVTKCVGMKCWFFSDGSCRLSRLFKIFHEEIKHSKFLPKYLKAFKKYFLLLFLHLSFRKEKYHPLLLVLIYSSEWKWCFPSWFPSCWVSSIVLRVLNALFKPSLKTREVLDTKSFTVSVILTGSNKRGIFVCRCLQMGLFVDFFSFL